MRGIAKDCLWFGQVIAIQVLAIVSLTFCARSWLVVVNARSLDSGLPLNMRDEPGSLSKGLLGTGSTFGGVALSFASQLEIWLRIASLSVGILVGLATLHSLLRKKK